MGAIKEMNFNLKQNITELSNVLLEKKRPQCNQADGTVNWSVRIMQYDTTKDNVDH